MYIDVSVSLCLCLPIYSIFYRKYHWEQVYVCKYDNIMIFYKDKKSSMPVSLTLILRIFWEIRFAYGLRSRLYFHSSKCFHPN